MKKKLLWIMALFAAFALLVTGCPTGGGGEPEDNGEDVPATGVYFASDAGGAFTKIQDASQTLTLTEDYVRIVFNAPGKDFQKIRVKFSLDQPFGVMQQCAFENDGEKGYTWGGTEDPDMYLDYADVFTYERDPVTAFTSNWSSKSGTFDKKQMVGICFSLKDGTGIKFTLNEITFVGIGKSSEPPAPPGVIEATNWYLSDTEDGSAATGNSVSGSNGGPDNCWYLYIYFNTDANLDDVILTFTVTGATIIKQCVYDDTGTWGWGWGDVTSGSRFNLSGATSWGASGTALNKATLKGICLKMEGTGTFTLTKVEIVR
jgi:hypothetical protein